MTKKSDKLIGYLLKSSLEISISSKKPLKLNKLSLFLGTYSKEIIQLKIKIIKF